MTTEKYGGESVPDAASYTMDPAEVLRRAEAFDPMAIMPELQRIKNANLSPEETLALQAEAALKQYRQAMCFGTNREAIMRLALEMILAQCKCFTESRAYIVDPIRRTAEQALRECRK